MSWLAIAITTGALVFTTVTTTTGLLLGRSLPSKNVTMSSSKSAITLIRGQ
jgi:hypothetical protein